jgi:hypothetical protein
MTDFFFPFVPSFLLIFLLLSSYLPTSSFFLFGFSPSSSLTTSFTFQPVLEDHLLTPKSNFPPKKNSNNKESKTNNPPHNRITPQKTRPQQQNAPQDHRNTTQHHKLPQTKCLVSYD